MGVARRAVWVVAGTMAAVVIAGLPRKIGAQEQQAQKMMPGDANRERCKPMPDPLKVFRLTPARALRSSHHPPERAPLRERPWGLFLLLHLLRSPA